MQNYTCFRQIYQECLKKDINVTHESTKAPVVFVQHSVSFKSWSANSWIHTKGTDWEILS